MYGVDERPDVGETPKNVEKRKRVAEGSLVTFICNSLAFFFRSHVSSLKSSITRRPDLRENKIRDTDGRGFKRGDLVGIAD